MENQLWQAIVDSGMLITLVGAVGTLLWGLIKFGSAWVESKFESIKNEKVKNALLEIERAVEAAVAQTAQFEVEAAKKAAADGKLTPEEIAEMKQIAIDRATSFVTVDAIEIAKKNVVDFDAWVSALVEKYVVANK